MAEPCEWRKGPQARHGPRPGRDPAARRRAATRACASSRSSWSSPTRASRGTSFDEAALAELAESIRARGVLQPIVVRAAARRRATSWSPASAGCARRGSPSSSRSPRSCARPTTGSGSSSRCREHGARGPEPVEEARACAMLVEDLGLTKEEVGRRVGPQPRRDLEPDPPARAARRGARADRGGRAERGARAGAPALQGPRRRAGGLARDARDEGWSVRETERRAREAEAGSAGAARARARSCTRTSRRRSPRRRTRSRRRSAARSRSRAKGDGCRSRSSSTAPPRRSSWPSGSCARRSRRARLSRASGRRYNRPRGRLAQSVRARL